MPTINQLIRKGRLDKCESVEITCFEQRIQLPEKPSNELELTAEAWCLYACWYDDTEEAELCSA